MSELKDLPLLPGHLHILTLLSDGKTTEEIAKDLKCPLVTAKRRIAAVIERINANNRPHAVALAIQRGLIKKGP